MSKRLPFIVIAVAALPLYIQHQQLQTAKARATLATEQRNATAANLNAAHQQVRQLQQQAAEKERQRAALAALQHQLERTLADRTTTIRRLQRENDELRQWADQPLPEPVARLRERPALTGADSYQHYLRDTGTLPPAGEQPTHQR